METKMKIHTKVVIDMESLEVIEDEFYNYNGPLHELKSGGAGGGSSSGTLDFPAYMKTAHGNWLDTSGADSMIYSVTDLMNEAMSGPSPYAGFVTVDIDAAFLGPNKGVANYIGPYDRLYDYSCYDIEAKYDEFLAIEESRLNDLVNAEDVFLSDEITSVALPKFQAGMLDINAVQSSAFVLGNALINREKAKALAKFSAQVRMETYGKASDLAFKRVQLAIENHRVKVSLSTEVARIYASLRHDIDGLYAELGAKDRMFDLSIYQYGVNVMSSISGSAISPPDTGTTKTSGNVALGAISGALSGAVMGASIGGWWGAGIGAVLGGVLGGVSSR
jgi:hypothetical protein